MDKRTKLITIDYDEYLELSRCKNNVEQQVLSRLIKEINHIRTMIKQNKKVDIDFLLKKITDLLSFQMTMKEGSNNES